MYIAFNSEVKVDPKNHGALIYVRVEDEDFVSILFVDENEILSGSLYDRLYDYFINYLGKDYYSPVVDGQEKKCIAAFLGELFHDYTWAMQNH